MSSWAPISVLPGSLLWLREARIRAQLKTPPMSVEDYLGKLVACGLVATAQALEQYAELI